MTNEQVNTELAAELERHFGDRAIDGLWCNVPAKMMLRILEALRHPLDRDAYSLGGGDG